MKFALLIYQPFPFDPKALSSQEHAEIAAGYGVINAMPNVTPGPPLGLQSQAVTVTVIDGKTTTAEGPFVGGAGTVGGFCIVEAETLDEAVAVAGLIPAARLGGAIEVRPCQVYW